MRRGSVLDNLFADFAAIAHAEYVDLYFRFEQGKTLRRYDGQRTRARSEMGVPDIEELRKIVDVGQIYLRLDSVLERTSDFNRDVIKNSVCSRISVPFQTALGARYA
jgi:hypothetical protein